MTPVVRTVRDQLGAVVNISATHVEQVRAYGGFFSFMQPQQRERTTNSVGSGAVIHPSGYVLTNAHVVQNASELHVTFANQERLPAETVALMPERDVAIMRVLLPQGHPPLQAVRLGHSDDLMVGEQVIAIGNPVGLQHTVTTGIISAVDRSLSPTREVTFKGVIQTDAAINPGNSGGPLFNILGEQIGVNTAIRSDAQNVGFAIPVDAVKELLPELLRVESQGRYDLGLQFGRQERGGLVAKAVRKHSPAERAGIREGDIVVAIDDVPTPTVIDALVVLLDQAVNRPFNVTLSTAAGKTKTTQLRIEEIPLPDGRALAQKHLGVTFSELSARRARKMGLREGTRALVVDKVRRNTDAAKEGLQKGDLVVAADGYSTKSLLDLGLIVEDKRRGDVLVIKVVRVERRGIRQGEMSLRLR